MVHLSNLTILCMPIDCEDYYALMHHAMQFHHMYLMVNSMWVKTLFLHQWSSFKQCATGSVLHLHHDFIPYSFNVVTNSLWATLPFYYIKCPIPRLLACEWHLVAPKWSHHILTYNQQNVSMALHTLYSLMACCPTGRGLHCALYSQKPHQTFITNRVWVTITLLCFCSFHIHGKHRMWIAYKFYNSFNFLSLIIEMIRLCVEISSTIAVFNILWACGKQIVSATAFSFTY